MAKKTPLTAAQIKEQKGNLKLASKALDATLSQHTTAVKDAQKALDAAKKEADKVVGAAVKAHESATKKHDKAAQAHSKGKAKVDAQLAALVPAAAKDAAD